MCSYLLIKNSLLKIIGKKNTCFPTGFSPWKMQFSFVSRIARIYYTQRNPKHIKSTGFQQQNITNETECKHYSIDVHKELMANKFAVIWLYLLLDKNKHFQALPFKMLLISKWIHGLKIIKGILYFVRTHFKLPVCFSPKNETFGWRSTQ